MAGAAEVAEALLAAGLEEADDATALVILAAGHSLGECPASTLLLEEAPFGPFPWRGERDVLVFPFGGGLRFSAEPDAAPEPVASLLRAARLPSQAAAMTAMFEALGDRLSLSLALSAAQSAAAREAEWSRSALARAEAAAASEAARRHAIEGSTVWRVSRGALDWIAARPRLASILRRTARIVWHRVVRPILRRRSAEPAAAGGGHAAETSFAIAEVGLMVFAAAPGGTTAITGIAVVEGGRRIASPAPPRTAPTGRIGRSGLAAFFPGTSALPGAALELILADGSTVERPLPARQALEPRAAIKAILSRVDPAADGAPALLREQVLPAIEACWAVARRVPFTVEEKVFGTPPERPAVSIVVPLYGRMDWILLQSVLFGDDPSLKTTAELIYVIDDPDRAAEAMQLAEIASRAHGVPIRLLRLSRNLGYSGATNAGARAARGELLLLLNSDVLPSGPGWLDALAARYRELPECGALGCRLVFDDGTLQHAGMIFRPAPELQAWICDHPLKGEAARRDPGTTPREVPAVTGACLMIARELYDGLGGLSEDYVIGDFEDADLCHRVIEAGRRVWYAPDVTLIHFERQSLVRLGSSEWRYTLTLCNMMLHARRWQDRLQRLAPLGPGAAP
ncbi:MAG: glycosyltransferase [Roseococcus sp.]|nr:glycosyltransferase [Roseococcus sp.]